MVSLPDRDGSKTGRHRPRWGRRILPRRWWRLVVAIVLVACAAGAGIGLRLRESGSPAPRRPAAAPALAGSTGGPGGPAPGVPATAGAGTAGRSRLPRPGLLTPTASSGPGSTGPARPAAGGVPAAATGGASAPAAAGGTPGGGSAVGAVGSTAVTGTPTATSSPVHPGAAGGLGLSGTALDLGPVNSSGTFDITNTAASPAPVTIGASATWLSLSPRGQTVPARGRTTVTVALDRAAAPTGPVSATVMVATTETGVVTTVGTVRVTATVGAGPTITSVTASPATLRPATCSAGGATTSTVTVVADSAVGLLGVDLDATLPDRSAAHTALALSSGSGDSSTWSGSVGPVGKAGQVSFTVTVTDLDNRVTTTRKSLSVSVCSS
jgi:hypothetical protein